jgi:hypothetical protein
MSIQSFVFEGQQFEDVVCERKAITSTAELAIDNVKQGSSIIQTFWSFFKIVSKCLHCLYIPKITLFDVPSDGKCFFHAISLGLKGSVDVSAIDMCEATLNHVFESGVFYEYEPTCPESDQLAHAASLLYKINIIIINLDTKLPLVYFNKDATDSVFLFNMNGHYWLVNIGFAQNVDLKSMRLKIAKYLYEL